MAAELRKLIDRNYSTVSESLPEIQSGESQLVKHSLMDQHEKHAMFCQILQVAGARMEGGPDGDIERIKLALEGYGDLGCIESIRPSLRCKFRVLDRVSGELPGLVEVEAEDRGCGSMSDRSSDEDSNEKPAEEKVSDESMGLVVVEEGVDNEVVSKWCGLLTKVGGKLSGSGICKYGLLRQLSNFNLGLINRVELGVVVTDMIREYPDLMHELVSLLPHGDGSNSECSSELAKENGTKRKRNRDAEAPSRGRSPVARKRGRRAEKQRRVRCRQITEDEEDDMGYSDVLEGQLAGALAYASHILRGPSDTIEWSHHLVARKAYLERIVKEIYGNEGLKVLAAVEEDPANTLPVVISRLQQKEQEHKNRKDQLRARISARAYGK